MSATPHNCVSRCRFRNRHVTTCADDDCQGCEPRAAEFGQLCAWCWQRLNADVIDTPALARHLWAAAQPGITPPPSGRGAGDPAERSILSGALDALDHLHATLASWAHLILEEHPDSEHMAGPDERGTRRTLSTVVEFEGQPMIRRSTVAGVRDPEATSRLVRWLLPLLPWCAAREWAGEMRTEVATTVRTTLARYPVAERTRRVPGVTCPGCDLPALLYDPATTERPTVQVSCTNRSCGRIYSEVEFTRLVRIIEWEHAESERIGA
jgi:hypothetical protein